MTRDFVRVGLIWGLLVVVGELLVLGPSYLPAQFSEEALVVDDAYILLAVLAVPVFAFVIAMVIYAPVRFKADRDEQEDGPPIATHRGVVVGWLAVTGALALFILINPGFVGLAEIRGDPSADMVIEVDGKRWSWDITYENGAVGTDELVVPVHTRIRFDVSSSDILHSFWVPAFRTKIDAVPGLITELYVTPTRTGDRDDDPGLRLQCAEFCGIGHGAMAIPVRVITPEEFDDYVTRLAAEATGGRTG